LLKIDLLRMPQGYYVVEQWMCSAKDSAREWMPVLVLPFGATLTAAEQALEKLREPGFYRIVQMQRVIWADQEAGVFKLRKSHANSPEGLKKMQEMFERCGGRYPHEEVRAARRLSKSKKKS
jgi:hypothetical protein